MSETTANENKAQTFVCPKHSKYTGEMAHYIGPEMSWDEPPPCPACQREAEEEKQRGKEIAAWQSMNIDDRFWDSTFDNFNAYNDELRERLETCRKFADNPDGKLVMLGKHGNGKTHLAISVLKKLGGKIYTATEISIMLRQCYGGGLNEWEVFDELCTTPLLVIDEVEKIKESDWKNYWMSHIVGKRYNRRLPIIFIANCHTQKDCTEQKKPCPYCLEYHLESDVISRITEDGNIMKFGSGDYRKTIRDKRFAGEQK